MNKTNYPQYVCDNFWKRVIIPKDYEILCWLWIGTKNPYGSFIFNGKTIMAHRFSYEYYNGDILNGLDCLHKCDNPPCVSPYHLFLGNQAENVRDMVSKNRHIKGSDVNFSVLTEDDVITILTDIHYNKYNDVNSICSKYNVSINTIKYILYGINWKHITNQLIVPLEDLKNKVICEHNNSTKQAEKRAIEIKRRLQQGQTGNHIAKSLNVSKSLVSRIKNGLSWDYL